MAPARLSEGLRGGGRDGPPGGIGDTINASVINRECIINASVSGMHLIDLRYHQCIKNVSAMYQTPPLLHALFPRRQARMTRSQGEDQPAVQEKIGAGWTPDGPPKIT